MTTAITASININQASIANGPFTIVGGGSSSAPVMINLTSDLVLTSANSLFSSASGHWIFNGNGHTITVGDSSHSVSNFAGLFNTINSAGVAKNFSIVSENGSTLGAYVGAVAATSDGLIDHVSTNFSSPDYGGGIVGGMSVTGSVENCFSTGDVSGFYAGGIVGDENYGSVVNSYSTGAITGGYSGGITGIDNFGDINNVYSTGIISGNYSGGITGIASGGGPGQPDRPGDITNAYSTGAMTATIWSGGITAFDGFGMGRGGSVISHTYTTGARTDTYMQALIAKNDGGVVISSFGSDGAPWSDSQAYTYLTGVGSVWVDPDGVNIPFTLASNPGANSSTELSNNPWVGNTLQIVITDTSLNGGQYFFADQVEQYGFGGIYGSPTQNLFNATYQWFADGVAISGATSSTLRMEAAFLGKSITANVAYINGYGYSTNSVHTPLVGIYGVFDTAANVSTYLDVIQTNHTAISNALSSTGTFQILDGANTATQFTVSQLTTAADALMLIAGQNYLVGVKDGAQNLASHLSAIEARIGDFSSLQITDSGVVTITSTQAASLASAFNVGNDFHAVGRHDAINILYNAASDGTLYIKTSGATLGTLASGTSILFENLFVSTSGLVTNGSTTPFFSSSGGINGLTLPDLFTGPSSLGLTYQLIETAQNAVVTGSSFSEFIKVADSNSIGKAVNGNGGNDVIDGGVGSTFVTGGANHNTTFFLDGRAPGESWSTITDFQAGVDKATIWGFVRGVSSIDVSFINYNNEGAAGYTGLTFHFKNLLPDGQTAGSNPNLNSITFTGHRLEEFGASSLAELNAQINAGTNEHIVVGSTQDSLGTHSYLYIH